jgi:hypothetical protein
MNSSDIENMEIFNVTNVMNMQIGFINIFKLTKYIDHPDANEDHFELVVTSMNEPPLFNKRDAGNQVIILIILTCVCGIGVAYWHYR